MKKKPEISFRVLEGSGPLAIYWFDGPYGDAIEAKKGSGVFWLSPNGELLGAEFDDVSNDSDDQILISASGIKVRVITKSGKVTVEVKSTSDAA